MNWSWKKECNTGWEIIFVKPIMNYKRHKKPPQKISPARRECQSNDIPLRKGSHKVLNTSLARGALGGFVHQLPGNLLSSDNLAQRDNKA